MAHPYVSFADFQDVTTSHGVHCIHFLGASDEKNGWFLEETSWIKLDKDFYHCEGFIYLISDIYLEPGEVLYFGFQVCIYIYI